MPLTHSGSRLVHGSRMIHTMALVTPRPSQGETSRRLPPPPSLGPPPDGRRAPRHGRGRARRSSWDGRAPRGGSSPGDTRKVSPSPPTRKRCTPPAVTPPLGELRVSTPPAPRRRPPRGPRPAPPRGHAPEPSHPSPASGPDLSRRPGASGPAPLRSRSEPQPPRSACPRSPLEEPVLEPVDPACPQ